MTIQNFKILQRKGTEFLEPISLKYQRFTTSGCKDIRIRQLEFVAKTQYLLGVIFSMRANKNICLFYNYILPFYRIFKNLCGSKWRFGWA